MRRPPAALRRRCMEAARAIAAMLQQRLESLPAAPAGDEASPSSEAMAAYAPTAQKALVVGRVALAVAGRSTALPVILGPPDLWQAAARGGGAGEGGGAAGAGLARRLGLGPAGGRLGAVGSGAPAHPAAAAPGPARSPKLEEVQQRFRWAGGRAGADAADCCCCCCCCGREGELCSPALPRPHWMGRGMQRCSRRGLALLNTPTWQRLPRPSRSAQPVCASVPPPWLVTGRWACSPTRSGPAGPPRASPPSCSPAWRQTWL